MLDSVCSGESGVWGEAKSVACRVPASAFPSRAKVSGLGRHSASLCLSFSSALQVEGAGVMGPQQQVASHGGSARVAF